MGQLKLLRADPTLRLEVFCDREEHVTIIKPLNQNDGFPNQVETGPCDCSDEHPQTHEDFEKLDEPPKPMHALKDCPSANSFAGMIKHCTLKAGHTGLHEAGDKKWA